MENRRPRRGRGNYKILSMLRTKTPLSVKRKGFFICFKCCLLVKYIKMQDTSFNNKITRSSDN